MSDTAPTGVPPPQGHHGLPIPPAPSAPWRPAPPVLLRRPSSWPTLAAIAIALVALGVGVGGWFRPAPRNDHPSVPSAPAYTDQQIADAKGQVCDSYQAVHTAGLVSTNRTSPVPGDPIGELAVAANARLALYAGGDYLLDRLAAEPATPPALADALRSFANNSKKLAIVALAEKPNSAQDPLRRALDADATTIDGLCK